MEKPNYPMYGGWGYGYGYGDVCIDNDTSGIDSEECDTSGIDSEECDTSGIDSEECDTSGIDSDAEPAGPPFSETKTMITAITWLKIVLISATVGGFVGGFVGGIIGLAYIALTAP